MRDNEEIRLDTPQGTLAGIHWPASGGPRVLCLHGWLDNAASFLPLAQHAAALDMVALDFPGHGLSSHRHHTARYHFADYLADIHIALEALKWPRCHLLGHSLGGGVSSLFAAGMPGRVLSLTMLDSLGPWTGRNNKAGKRLKMSLENLGKPSRSLKPYASIEAMAQARRDQADISLEAAALLCHRGARRVDDHFKWRSDPRLHWIAPMVLSEEHALDCVSMIQAPALSILATPLATRWAGPEADRRQAAMPTCRVVKIEGNHHVHMDEPAAIGDHVVPFILQHHQGDTS